MEAEAAAEVVEEGIGEEEAASADGADPAAAIGEDDGPPPLTVAVDAMIGLGSSIAAAVLII